MPKNAATQRRYSGVNVLILWDAVIERGFAGQSWLTFRQALSLGGNVRKGEHGTTVVYADRFTPDEERQRAERDGDEPNAIPFLKRFTVFNTDQCENLPAALTTAPAAIPDGLILPDAEALIAATGADFRIGGERAFYSPSHDFIQVPRPDAYFEPINWHRTALHELGHWSGHRAHVVAAKAGLDGLTKALATDLGDQGVTVNLVAPGLIETVRGHTCSPHAPRHHQQHRTLVGRRGTPEEVAAMVRFLVGPDGRYVTGQTIHVNGGAYLP